MPASPAGSRVRPRANRRYRRYAWVFVAAGAICVVLQIASIPLYAGSALGAGLSWRFEHGRLTITKSRMPSREGFFIAFNSEGLRFLPAMVVRALGDWSITIPIWMPLAACAGGAFVCFRRAGGAAAAACGSCGYDLSGLPGAQACPECGFPTPARGGGTIQP